MTTTGCRFGDECIYVHGTHRDEGDHAWTDATPAIVNGKAGVVRVHCMVDSNFPNEILVGLQQADDLDFPTEARLSMEQAAYLLAVLAKAVYYGQPTSGGER